MGDSDPNLEQLRMMAAAAIRHVVGRVDSLPVAVPEMTAEAARAVIATKAAVVALLLAEASRIEKAAGR